MTNTRRRFSPEFKLEAAQLIVDQEYTVRAACKSMGVSKSTMECWVRRLRSERGLIPRLRGGGRIVLFSSMAGRVATPMLGDYSSSKHALEALADAMRVELKSSNISVSLIEPGGVATPMAFSQGDLVTHGLESMNEGTDSVTESCITATRP